MRIVRSEEVKGQLPLATCKSKGGIWAELYCPQGKRDDEVRGTAMGVHKQRKESPHAGSERRGWLRDASFH